MNANEIESVPAATFRYSYEEFLEAHLLFERLRARLSAERSKSAAPPSRRAQWFRALFALPIFGGIYAILQLRGAALPAFLRPRPGEYPVLRILLPLGMFFAIALLLIALARRKQFGGFKLSSSREDKITRIGWVVLAVMVFPMLAIIATTPAARDSVDDLLHELVMLIVPWILIAALWLKSHRKSIQTLRDHWNQSTQLHGEKHIDLDDTAFHLSGADSRYELTWQGLECEEGDALFLLLSGSIFYMLPKRVMTMEQVAFMREHFRLGPEQPRTGGFPVLPPKPMQ